MKSVAFHNLGCKVNTYEMDVMLGNLEKAGYKLVDFEQKADIYIINTCTVTNIADRKSRQILHRARKENPDGVVVAVGCYVQNGLDDPSKDDAVDIVIGNNRKNEIVRIIEEYLRDRKVSDNVADIAHEERFEDMTLISTAEHTRAFIKIEDGCNQFCSYCAIPLARGRVRSRDAEKIIEEVRGISEKGYREVVLTGIHVSSYGLDFLGLKSADYEDACRAGFLLNLIDRIAEIPGIARIRLGSLEPRIVDTEFARRLAANPKVCPHFHLSLQSGCDETLRRMNRHYDTNRFEEGTKALREAFGGKVAITTDVIVGFPGEDEREFEESFSFLEKIGFYEMHIFRYSRRKNTPADKMKNQVREEDKALRSDRAIELSERFSKEYRARYIGNEMELLLEEEITVGDRKYFVGHTMDYVMGAVDGQGFKAGDIVKGRAVSFLRDDLLSVENASYI